MRPAVLLLAAAGLTGCVDELDQQVSRIDRPRVLAVIPTPAEAAPREAVTYAAVVAAPDGPVATPAIAWAYCTAPKPPTEDNVVPPGCVDDPAALVSLGDAPAMAASATLPAEACATYGPDTPPGGFRPRDPDPSGGYYQPVRAGLDGAPLAFGLHRLACNLGDAPPAIVREYRERYVRNQHPVLTSLGVARAGAPADPAAIAAGEPLTLVATWPADATEPYVVYDRARAVLEDRVEVLRVGWFVTGGALAADATGGGEVAWTAPSTPGRVHAWAVLHDDRGGIAAASLAIDVH